MREINKTFNWIVLTIVCFILCSCTRQGNEFADIQEEFFEARSGLHTEIDLIKLEEVWSKRGKYPEIKTWFSADCFYEAVLAELRAGKSPYVWFERGFNHIDNPGFLFDSLATSLDVCLDPSPGPEFWQTYMNCCLYSFSSGFTAELYNASGWPPSPERDMFGCFLAFRINQPVELRGILTQLNSGTPICDIVINSPDSDDIEDLERKYYDLVFGKIIHL